MKVEAVFFDCDGVISDNEKEAHQVAFNQAFKEKEINIFWDDETYMKLLKIAGGKERLQYYFDKNGWPEENEMDFLNALHQLKSTIYQNIILSGKLKARPGIISLMHELSDRNIAYAICSTSKKESVFTIAEKLLDKESYQNLSFILAGDMVKQKKPDPEIYLKAAEKLAVNPKNCLVIEDSETGLKAGKAAGMKVVITKSYYSKNDIFDQADLIFENLENISYDQIVNKLH